MHLQILQIAYVYASFGFSKNRDICQALFLVHPYYQWVMWIMNGSRKVQQKSEKFIAADFERFCHDVHTVPLERSEKEIIRSGVYKCYTSADPGPEFEVEPVPKKMDV